MGDLGRRSSIFFWRDCSPKESIKERVGDRNFAMQAFVLQDKSPLRQRAHSPLSPKPRPLFLLVFKESFKKHRAQVTLRGIR